MSDLGKSILTRLKNDDNISEILINLLYMKDELDYNDSLYLFSVAQLLIEEFEKESEKSLLIEYAYYIIAVTCFKINDFRALYDFSINIGFYPLSRKILNLNLINDLSIKHLLSDAQVEHFNNDGKILTLEQYDISEKVLNSKEQNISFIAPTSYGKSELIFDHIKKNKHFDNIAIIVPTKALIDQVHRDAKKIKNLERKLIVHDQNYDSSKDNRVLAIVTQERALRLFEKGLIFNLVYIDEAHEIMDFDYRNGLSNRSLLLTRFIRLTHSLNSEVKIFYLSPLIQDVNNIRYDNQSEIQMNKIHKNLKLLNIYFLNSESILKQYDKYLNAFIPLQNHDTFSKYVVKKSLDKNLHFLYRPIYIEKYSKKLYESLHEETNIPSEIQELIMELKELVHSRFVMATYLSKGIIYLHGIVPLIIRNYILKFVNENKFIKHFVANSVILAGMNMPIDNLFYISGFSKNNDLQNLIGRVNRMNEIFKPENKSLKRIFTPVHFIELEEYPQHSGGRIIKKIEGLRNNLKDEVRNPLLETAKVENDNKFKAEKIREIEEHIINNYSNPDFLTKLSSAGAQQLLNYNDIGLDKIHRRIKNWDHIKDDQILESLKKIFFDGFSEREFNPQFNAKRLERSETIAYYKMFISNIKKYPLNRRIENTVGYWKKRTNDNYKVYVGRAFGEEVWDTSNYLDGFKVYVNIDKHIDNANFLYNLALIKLQVDEDYLGHEITLLVNTLLEFELISESQFNKFIYGTDTKEELLALQIGISRNTYLELKKNEQIRNIKYDRFGNPLASKDLKNYISKQKGILKFELEKHFL